MVLGPVCRLCGRPITFSSHRISHDALRPICKLPAVPTAAVDIREDETQAERRRNRLAERGYR